MDEIINNAINATASTSQFDMVMPCIAFFGPFLVMAFIFLMIQKK